MEIWYNATYGSIEEIAVLKSTSKTITLKNNRRCHISSEGTYYAKTRDEAKDMLFRYYREIRDLAQSRLDHAELNLKKVKAL